MLKEIMSVEIPIEQAIKNVLLEKRKVPPWLENIFVNVSLELTGDYPKDPIEGKAVYKTLWYFSKMTPEQISELDKSKLGSALAILETEDQDDLVRRLPTNLEKDFWDFVEKYDYLEGLNEFRDQAKDK